MSKQYTVNLSPRQSFDLWLFIFGRGGVVPKNREESRSLRGVCETFGVTAVKEQVEALSEGKNLTTRDFSTDTKPMESGSVDLNKLLAYLDDLSKAEPALSDRLLDISDELLRVKEGKPAAALASVTAMPALAAVPEAPPAP